MNISGYVMTTLEIPTQSIDLPLTITLDYYKTISSNKEYNAIIESLTGTLDYNIGDMLKENNV
jgi:hypothetical protein